MFLFRNIMHFFMCLYNCESSGDEMSNFEKQLFSTRNMSGHVKSSVFRLLFIHECCRNDDVCEENILAVNFGMMNASAESC